MRPPRRPGPPARPRLGNERGYYDRRRRTAEQASERDLMDAAHAHRRIYQAIRAHDADAARLAMHEHLLQAAAYQAQEPVPRAAPHRNKKRKPS